MAYLLISFTISLDYVLRLHNCFKHKHRASQSKPSAMRLKFSTRKSAHSAIDVLA